MCKLHCSATQKAQAYSIALGVIDVLILWTEMSLDMTDPGDTLGELSFFRKHGGLARLAAVAPTYPLYNCVLKKKRKKIAPEILCLTEELLK